MQDDQILEYASFSELDELDKLLNFYTTLVKLHWISPWRSLRLCLLLDNHIFKNSSMQHKSVQISLPGNPLDCFFSNPFSKNLVFDHFEEKNCSGTFFFQSERFFTSRIDLYSASERFFTPRNVFHCPCKIMTKSCHFSDLENPFVLRKMLRNFEQFWMLFERSCIRTFFLTQLGLNGSFWSARFFA